ncbi:hypothetical protein F4775DRAFT_285832 [Biscogniauxia sp. FL1348]|nr:hypothetical protein F4775DRAFT_285832 [Biscogniauxia sp. FL1348]
MLMTANAYTPPPPSLSPSPLPLLHHDSQTYITHIHTEEGEIARRGMKKGGSHGSHTRTHTHSLLHTSYVAAAILPQEGKGRPIIPARSPPSGGNMDRRSAFGIRKKKLFVFASFYLPISFSVVAVTSNCFFSFVFLSFSLRQQDTRRNVMV